MSLSDARMDWIIEMYAKDHPDEFTVKPSSDASGDFQTILALKAWSEFLMGDTLKKAMYPHGKPVIPDAFKVSGRGIGMLHKLEK